MSRPRRGKRAVVARMLYLDIFFDPRTRPIMAYVTVTIALGASLYRWFEGWSWLDSIYFVVITLTTIGYGDFVPTTPFTKILTIFFSLNGIVLLLVLFDIVRTKRGWQVAVPDGEQDDNPDKSSGV